MELFLSNVPDNGRKRLYQLVLGGRQSIADSRTRITWLLESSLDTERIELHKLLVNHKSLYEAEFEDISNYLIEMAPDKERETLLTLVLRNQCLLVRHYDEMITWLVQDEPGDVNDWTTVRNMTICLYELGVVPESEATWLYPLVIKNNQPSVGDYKAIIIRLLGPSLTLEHQQLHKLLVDVHEDDRTDYQATSLWLLGLLPNTRRNLLYRQVVENNAVLDDSHDTMIAWLLGFAPETNGIVHHESLPDNVFDRISSIIEHGTGHDNGDSNRSMGSRIQRDTRCRIPTRAGRLPEATSPLVDLSHSDAELQVIEAYLEESGVWSAPEARMIPHTGYSTPTSIYSIGNPFGEAEQMTAPLVWPTLNYSL